MFTDKRYYIVFLFIYTLIFSMLMPDSRYFFDNISLLLGEQTYLIHDFLETAGLSVTFFNVAMHFLIVYFLLKVYGKTNVTGLEFAALGTFIGHAFFGTHYLNVLPIIFGGLVYVSISRDREKSSQPVILFATGTAPLVSYLALGTGHTLDNFIISSLLGFVLGFLSLPLAEHFHDFHKGFSLYNFGFTTGIISMIALLILEYFGVGPPPVKIVLSEFSVYPIVYFLGILLFLVIYLFVHRKKIRYKNFKSLTNSKKNAPNDYLERFGLLTTLLNMFINGSIYLLILILVSGHLSGPILGGLINLLGFSAFGKNIKNCYPISIGIFIGAFLSQIQLSDLQFQLALLFSCSLAPISSKYGKKYGIIAGLIHLNMVIITFWLHKGLSLYNNGFSTVIVAAVLFPIIEVFEDIF
ncbi:TPA: DUF1576 domain-containing protein [Streptococcus suis]|nr:DUF1576 domain-containing protein [Streptococcus suis]